ncbi:MAG: hypothetical protein AB1847_06600 [bacterium]
MKKKFQLFVVLALVYAFICCPVFSGSAFAEGEGRLFPSAPIQTTIENIKTTAQFIIDNFSTWVDEMIVPPLSTDDVKSNREKRVEIRQQILEKLGFNRTK